MTLFDPVAINTVKVTPHWHLAKDGDPAGLALYERHYSAYEYQDGRARKLFTGPGEKLVLIARLGDALFVWRRFIEQGKAEPDGVNCAVFRNESPILSSTLVREADALAFCRWPGERHYTFVNPSAVRSTNPGTCFKKAGWHRTARVTSRGLIELELLP